MRFTDEGDIFQQGVNCFYARQLNAAEKLFRKTLRRHPAHEGALNLLTATLMHLGRFSEAESFARRAANLPKAADATFSNYGLILKQLGKPAEAIVQFDRALEIAPSNPETWNNRGAALNDLARYGEAVASFDKAIALAASYAPAYYNRAKSLLELGDFAGSLANYDKAIAITPEFAEAWCGRSHVLLALRSREEALASVNHAIALKPDLANALSGRAIILHFEGRYAEAARDFDRALALDPTIPDLESLRFLNKMRYCDWTNFHVEYDRLTESIARGGSGSFELLAILDSPNLQFEGIRNYVARYYPKHDNAAHGIRHHDRIRVAYLSSDLREHPIAHLLAGVFEYHDRSRFEVTALSCGNDVSRSETRRRIETSFERFIDASDYSIHKIVELIHALEIDILVDLNGFTSDHRAAVLARRPAPIQVNYLGFPGTMGAPFMDYIIADPIIIREEHLQFYSEAICWLPNSYQANDFKRRIGDKNFSRPELGLPENGFVFCCFNNNYKITPDVFSSWMRILNSVPGSVLWLFEDNQAATINLRREAQQRGIDASRLVFAERCPLPDHLARHRQADLFLDTLPYNAHTTASDALWTGVPVLTRIGNTFAGRVAASLLHAVSLEELITDSVEQYEALAIALSRDHFRYSEIKARLAANRTTTPLFDTAQFTRDIEAAYVKMYERYQAGLPPGHIRV